MLIEGQYLVDLIISKRSFCEVIISLRESNADSKNECGTFDINSISLKEFIYHDLNSKHLILIENPKVDKIRKKIINYSVTFLRTKFGNYPSKEIRESLLITLTYI